MKSKSTRQAARVGNPENDPKPLFFFPFAIGSFIALVATSLVLLCGCNGQTLEKWFPGGELPAEQDVPYLLKQWLSAAEVPEAQEVEHPARQVVIVDTDTAEDGTPVPAGNLRDGSSTFEFAVYLPEAVTAQVRKQSEKLLQQRIPGVILGAAERQPSRNTEVLIRTPDIQDYLPPTEADLRYSGWGFDEASGKQAAQSKSVLVLVFYARENQFHKVYKAAVEVVHQLAVALNGYPWDEYTREIFTPAEWKTRRFFDKSPLDIARQIDVYVYRPNDFIRVMTLGMAKFGLPDLVSENVANTDSGGIKRLTELACQLLYEKQSVGPNSELVLDINLLKNKEVKQRQLQNPGDGARGKHLLPVRLGKPQKTDADNRILALQYPGETPQVGQAAAVKVLYGSSDEVRHFDNNVHRTTLVKQARAKAMKELLEIKVRFISDRRLNEVLHVKAPFTGDDGGVEWMWVEVVRWEGTRVVGVLVNEPYSIANLHAGARITVEEKELLDYLHWLDGKETGNETAKLLHD